MGLDRKAVDLLHIPRQPDGARFGMRGKPTVVMAATLTDPVAARSETKKRNEQDIRNELGDIVRWLHQFERPGFEIRLAQRIQVFAKSHGSIGRGEVGEGDPVSRFEKELCIAARGSFTGVRAIKSYYGPSRDRFDQRNRRPIEQQRPNRGGLGDHVLAADRPKRFSKIGFCNDDPTRRFSRTLDGMRKI